MEQIQLLTQVSRIAESIQLVGLGARAKLELGLAHRQSDSQKKREFFLDSAKDFEHQAEIYQSNGFPRLRMVELENAGRIYQDIGDVEGTKRVEQAKSPQ
jgi:hypothetical protein